MVLAMIVVGGVSCGSFNKLLKANDTEQMYHAALDYYDKGDYEKTLQLINEVQPRLMGTMREDTIMYYTGCSYYKQGDFNTSALIFDNFRHRYGRSPFLSEVEYMYAMGYYFASPAPDRDQTDTQQAIIAVSEYIERYPNSPKAALCEVRMEELRGKLYDKALINARTYYKIGRYESAVIALENALHEFPKTPHREEILYLTTISSYELALNSISSRQIDRYLDVLESYYNLIAEFPETEHRRQVDNMHKRAKKFLDKNNTEQTVPQDGEGSESDETIQK